MINSKGNATLEAAISLPIVLVALLILFLGFYGLYLQASFQHQTYEYLLCAEFNDEFLCQQKLKKTLTASLPFGYWQVMTPPPSSNRRQVRIYFTLAAKGAPSWRWQYQNQINRDLSSSSF